MRVVIIDDELLIIKSIADSLVNAGHQVLGRAGHVAGGLKLIEGAQIDLAIVDVNLNGESSEPLVKRLSDLKIPVLLISGYSDAQRPGWTLERTYLQKPFGPEDLFQAMAGIGG